MPDTCLIQRTSFSLKCAEDNESENKSLRQIENPSASLSLSLPDDSTTFPIPPDPAQLLSPLLNSPDHISCLH